MYMEKNKNLDLLLVEYAVIRLAMCDIYTRDKDRGGGFNSGDSELIYNPQYEEENFWEYGWVKFNRQNNFSTKKISYIPYFIFMGSNKKGQSALIEIWNTFAPNRNKELNIHSMFLRQMVEVEETVKQKKLILKEFKLFTHGFYSSKIKSVVIADNIINNNLKETLSNLYNIPLEELNIYFDIIDASVKMLHYRLYFMAERGVDLLSYWTCNSLPYQIFHTLGAKKHWTEEVQKRFNATLLTCKYELGPYNV